MWGNIHRCTPVPIFHLIRGNVHMVKEAGGAKDMKLDRRNERIIRELLAVWAQVVVELVASPRVEDGVGHARVRVVGTSPICVIKLAGIRIRGIYHRAGAHLFADIRVVRSPARILPSTAAEVAVFKPFVIPCRPPASAGDVGAAAVR